MKSESLHQNGKGGAGGHLLATSLVSVPDGFRPIIFDHTFCGHRNTA